jgi:hypothetical protein
VIGEREHRKRNTENRIQESELKRCGTLESQLAGSKRAWIDFPDAMTNINLTGPDFATHEFCFLFSEFLFCDLSGTFIL